VSCSWAQEADLDIEWAHAIAPNARIVLVEAASNYSNDLALAVRVANSIVSPGGAGFGEVSMSWGFSEFAGETSFDRNFSQRGVVYVAASGDIGGQRSYPGVSPHVVSAGGTTLNFNLAGQFTGESAWSNGGGGPSIYEPRPAYQNAIVSRVGSRRGSPDVAFDADPRSGVAVYDSTPCGGISGWFVAGGTSLASPAVAGVLNLAGHFYASSDIELGVIYSHLGSVDFRDVASGRAGIFSAVKGWDFVTGVGSSLGLDGK
jgi:subtilase family serine protease